MRCPRPPWTVSIHLEGETVQVLVDGAVDPDNVVVGGQITTQFAGITFLVGLKASCRIEGLPRTGGNKGGTSQGVMKRNVFIYARVLTSIPPMINGVRAPDRTPATPMNTPEPGRTHRHPGARPRMGSGSEGHRERGHAA